MVLKPLLWRQVNAWRLAQHCLSVRLERYDLVRAATRTCGIQAQVMSAAEWALGSRVDGLVAQDVQAALWQERSLVKTWAMRGALHLVAASDLPLYVAARSYLDNRNWIAYFNYFGISQTLYETFIAAAPQVLSSEPMTREQLALAMAEYTGSEELRQLVQAKGWGTPLKPLAWRGDLCFGPSRGKNVTFVHPSRWLGSWQSLEPFSALQEILRRYLRAYGPSTPEQFALWWWGGGGVVPARKLFKSIADELAAVEVEGWRAFALETTLEPLKMAELEGTVNLLPLFDGYVLGLGRGRELEPLLPAAFQKQVYRPQGWISAVVLVDGYIEGVWEYRTSGAQTALKVQLFTAPAAPLRHRIAAEAERLGAFLNRKVGLVFEER
jgi:hypothetical protein